MKKQILDDEIIYLIEIDIKIFIVINYITGRKINSRGYKL